MSRSQTRERNRHARRRELVAAFNQARDTPEAFAAFLRLLAADDLIAVWAIARDADRNRPLDETERAMIAQVVAPRLAGMTPGWIERRRKLTASDKAKTTRPSDKHPDVTANVGTAMLGDLRR